MTLADFANVQVVVFYVPVRRFAGATGSGELLLCVTEDIQQLPESLGVGNFSDIALDVLRGTASTPDWKRRRPLQLALMAVW